MHIEAVTEALDDAGHHYNEFDRGIFHALYTRDHNGLVVELETDQYVTPDDQRGEVLALAQAKRVEAGADDVEGEHLEAALKRFGLPVERAPLPDAPTGPGVE